MSFSEPRSLKEADARLDVLDHNLRALQQAAEDLATEEPDSGLAFMSLCQAFTTELTHLRESRGDSITDRQRLTLDTFANLGTIRADGDTDAIEKIDERTKDELQNWE